MLGLFRSASSSSRRLPDLAVESLEERSVPAVFTVTNQSDNNPGSLRQAIMRANALAGPDVIRFAPQFDATIRLTTGDINITDDLTIQGPGAGRCIVSGTGQFRIFDLVSNTGPINVSISGLKLTRGLADIAVDGNDGGAIYVGSNNLTLKSCVITGNRAQGSGGAIFSEGGSVRATNTTFSNNSAGDSGGALYLDESLFRATHCRFLNNAADLDGGALYGNGQATIRDCVISGNTGSEGGAIEWSGGNLVIERTTIRNNTALYGGGLSVDGGRLTVRNSTIAFNRTNGNGTEGGAGMLLEGITSLIVQSTISGNVDQTTNPSDYTGGGGIQFYGGTAVIRNCTIAFNSTTGQGGGLFVDGDASVNVVSTICSNNQAPGGNFDVARTVGSLARATASLFQKFQPGFLNNGSVRNLVGVNPRLLPLADNGGPTLTHSFTLGSPARDAGANPDGLRFDQRGPGFPRVKNGFIDIGALEL